MRLTRRHTHMCSKNSKKGKCIVRVVKKNRGSNVVKVEIEKFRKQNNVKTIRV